jgi:hypothetical protein
MEGRIMSLLSLETILNLIYLASIVVLLGYGHRGVILADMGNAVGIEL